jgi:hypothetical protein
MKFTKTVNIWELSTEERAKLQPGQWVRAGENGALGRFFGEGRSTVVAWLGNAKGSRDYRGYMATLRDYGRNTRRLATI